MARARLTKKRRKQLVRLAGIEALVLLMAFLPSRRGHTENHDLLARQFIDQPGWIVSSLVNFVLLNLLMALFLFAAMKYAAWKKR